MREQPAFDPAVGLCSLCEHARAIRSGRGSRFWLCERAARDPALRKYPALPRAACHGFSLIDAIADAPPCEDGATD